MVKPYKPIYIRKYETGLVQNRVNFILPDDAFPILENAYVWRERIKRKQGSEFLGRLRRNFTSQSLGNYTTVNGVDVFNIFSALGVAATEPDAELQIPSIQSTTISFAAPIAQNLSVVTNTNTMTVTGVGPITGATIDFLTGDVTITANAVVGPAAVTYTGAYHPTLPMMGIRSRQLDSVNNEMTIFFDTKYAYRFTGGQFQEFIPGTTWSGNDSDFFWTTNWWVSATNRKLFWVTNFSGASGDPIRYTDGVTWTNFAPTINAAADVLGQALILLPFRGRLLALNTIEGPSLATGTAYFQRIRWSAIGSPFTANAWRDDIRGQGGFLDIPTSENIVSAGFVRDNLVIYCESSTWQLRYTGRSIQPFQIEKVNTELGAESTFSAVQFDTSLVGIGDKGIVECDSFKSERIDVKIPDLVFYFNNNNNGTKRVHGIRDFFNRLVYWTYPYKPESSTYPNRRLCYNYENDSWAIFTDSFTCLGNYQPALSRRWVDSRIKWQDANFPWIARPSLFPAIVGGNQQGYVLILMQQVGNDASLSIQGITGQTTLPTLITSPKHNMQTGQVIEIVNIPTGTPFASSLNEQVFSIVKVDDDTFELWEYDDETGEFSTPNLLVPASYFGGGEIQVRDNFRIQTKKFNFLDQGQTINFGYCDLLVDSTDDGAFSMNVYIEYEDSEPVNTLPQNIDPDTNQPDSFFNVIVPTSINSVGDRSSTKTWSRVYCTARGSFISLEYTFNNAQMAGNEQQEDVQIQSQIVHVRPSGSQLPFGA